MTTRIAINGFGRIGRSVLRALYENRYYPQLQIVAINELADIDSVSYMLRYDSTHGRFPGDVVVESDHYLRINGDRVRLYRQPSPDKLDWSECQVDIVLECSGQIRSRADAEAHLLSGAGKVLISNPADSAVDNTIVYGINHTSIRPHQRIISNSSCSTNCLVPVLTLLEREFGIERGVTTTIHSAMNDQPVIDAYSSDLRRTRSAVQSIIPVDTGLPKGIARLMPTLEGKLESLHLRVPTINVSALDVSLQLKCDTSAQAVNELIQSAANGVFRGLLGISYEPHASIDFNHDPRSGIVDATQTRVSAGSMLKLLLWFDNEWGFANRMLDTALCMRQAPGESAMTASSTGNNS
ncbi:MULTISPECIES: type I glyceraldehyde-3-phosphate dehydrogenase [Oceanospirillaceae]|uniref:Glyceraldehyde 3-phosphate dehydrogenase NAD-binding domain-containing protein n=1 Tax=Oceanobacter antarcticus TaxID=3133425 RepID=A0ABW8NJP9_9GAMM|tara:strand:+ start:11646 stop:12704 length:1059 start_codon:yes stop_codon:yes gene_type:complete